MKKYIILFLIIIFTFLISGCLENKSIVKIEIDNDTIQESYYLNEFNIKNIKLLITYDDSSINIVQLEESYMNKSVHEISSNVGEHKIIITYMDFEIIMNINIVNEIFEILYYYDAEVISESSHIKNEVINDLYDYETIENDTIWYYDDAFTKKVELPINIKENINLYTDNKPIEYIENNVIYREKQDGTYMVYGTVGTDINCLFVPEEINSKKVTSISNNLNNESETKGPYNSVFLPKTITEIPINLKHNMGASFFRGLYYINDIDSGLVVNSYDNKQYTGGSVLGSVAFKIEDYIIEDNVIYGLIGEELYLLDCLFEFKDEFIIPSKVRNYNVVGIACFSGIAGKANKIVVSKNITNIEIFSFSGFKNNEQFECEIIFECDFKSIEENFSLLFKGDYNFNIIFKNDLSTSFEKVNYEIQSSLKYFVYHYGNIKIKFSDEVILEYYNGVVLENIE